MIQNTIGKQSKFPAILFPLPLSQGFFAPGVYKKSDTIWSGCAYERICSEEVANRRHREALKAQLVNRGYDGAFVETELIKVDNKKREDL
ncbi:hypothetical protein DPMN_096167 [Dreissena polymorpha]|uniref:Uncharacterized protein n=1 Tax=Dreissena polymorpha TaxID=45954 RepID=A0A9D4R569_DREPO|nr:hypothetical protein DPMN_096167 [Dreissena polymorpha]